MTSMGTIRLPHCGYAMRAMANMFPTRTELMGRDRGRLHLSKALGEGQGVFLTPTPGRRLVAGDGDRGQGRGLLGRSLR